MPELQPLPDAAVTRPLSRAQAAAFGVRAGELRGPLWRAPLRGVHEWAFVDALDPATRARQAALVLPEGAAIGGWAAAHLLGAVDLDGLAADGETPLPVLLCLPRADRIRRPAGVRPFRSNLGEEDVVVVDGVPVTSSVRTAFDLARLARSRTEGVTAVDAVLRATDVTVAQLSGYIEQHRRWRGVPRARQVALLADHRAASCGESRLRLLWMDAGLPRPEVNRPALDLAGRLLGGGRPRRRRRPACCEYDGWGHREERRHAANNVREELGRVPRRWMLGPWRAPS